jgi:hypothetical protein
VCSFGTRDIVDVLLAINDFLDQNPSEIIIIPMELNSEVDQPVDLFELYDIMLEVPGFVDRLYVHPDPADPWPTLGTLVETDQVSIIRRTRVKHFARIEVFAYSRFLDSVITESHRFSYAWRLLRH